MEHIKNDLEEKARYFGVYIGIAEFYSRLNPQHPWELKGIGNNNMEIFCYNESYNDHIKDCQLILKPLSKLTEQDAKKVFDCVDGDCGKLRQALIEEFTDDITLSEWIHLTKLGYAIPVKGEYNPFELEWVV